jgi:hypothetical protein
MKRDGEMERVDFSRERSELSISQLSMLHSPRFLIELSTMLFLHFYQQPTTHNSQRLSRATHPVGRSMPPPLSQRGS